MSWKITQKKIGRAGGIKARMARQAEWNKTYGEGNWTIGYSIDGIFVLQEEALESIYYESYNNHFKEHPEDLKELIRTAKVLRNPHASATTGVDLQVPAIMDYLKRNNFKLKGKDVVDIGTWRKNASHAISIRLSPLHIKCVINKKITLEKFWQSKKRFAIWEKKEI